MKLCGLPIFTLKVCCTYVLPFPFPFPFPLYLALSYVDYADSSIQSSCIKLSYAVHSWLYTTPLCISSNPHHLSLRGFMLSLSSGGWILSALRTWSPFTPTLGATSLPTFSWSVPSTHPCPVNLSVYWQ